MKKIYFLFAIAMMGSLMAFAQNSGGSIKTKTDNSSVLRNPEIFYVNDDATGDNTGTSWANAFTSFQSVLDIANIGNQIWVAAGTYKPSHAYDFENSSRYYHFRMIEGVAIYGGFAGTEDSINQRSDFGMGGANETILSGDIGIVGDSTDNCYYIFYHPENLNLTGAAKLDGFTITLGYADGGAPSYPGRGAGMCNVINSSPSISNTVFLNNYAYLNGGGLHNNESDPTLTNVLFISNSAGNFGGGMYNYKSAPSITDATFLSNSAGTNGGGMSNRVSSSSIITNVTFQTNNCAERGGGLSNVDHSSPTITKVTFHENSAGIDGGGVYNKDHSSPNIVNAEFLSNSSNHGGALYSYDYSHPVVTNATFSKNNAGVRGGGIYIWNDASATFNNCIIWGNTTTPGINGQQICVDGDNAFMNYCCISDIAEDIYIMEGTFTATDTINANPKFIDPAGDLRIYGNSPCVNTGNNNYNSESYDIRGEARIQNTTIDMGAYEWTAGIDQVTDTVYVSADASGDNTGTNWTNALTSFQAALNLAASGDQVWVAAGTYKPSYAYDLTNSSRYYHFRMIEGVEIYGGFAGTETALSQRTDFAMDGANETILSGDIYGDNCYHVFFHPDGLNITNTAKLDGFTIKKGSANGSDPHDRGGGMYSHNSAPIITNVTFLENNAINYGGAMHTKGIAPSISHVSFLSNYAGKNGGGMDNNTTNIQTITNVTFLGNIAGESGGGIHNYHSSPAITNVTFIGNLAGNQGGGLNNFNSSPTITNATFSMNWSGYGGGISNYNSSSPTLNNCIMWGNIVDNEGQQIYLDGDTCTLNYCCYANETNDVTTANGGTLTVSNNNITTNPKFVNPEGDSRICGNSPCVNAGNNDYNTQSYDIRGEARIQNAIIDMGAYEWTPGLDPATSTVYVRAGAIGNNNGTNWRNAFTSFQSALEIVAPGEQVWVATGTYKPSYDYGLNIAPPDTARGYHFRMIEGVAIYGGFAGTETALSQRTDFGLGGVNETILSGDIGIEDDNTDNCYHVFFHPANLNLTDAAILNGFTITGGNADGTDSHDRGGGMMNDGQCSPTITNVSYKMNAAVSGGGMFNSNSNPVLTNVLFLLNNAVQSGGGIYNDLSSPTITNVTFSLNSADSLGGGLYNLNSSPSFFNSIVWGNTSFEGMQLYMDGGSTSLNYSCYADGAGDTTVVNSAILTVTNNNITANPKFVDPANDLRPVATSPCVNAGNNDYNFAGTDIRGEARIQDTVIDMGAYEWISGSDPYGIYYVKHNAAGSNNGTNWADAFTSLQSALDLSVSGDQVWVAAGTYEPSYDYGLNIPAPDTARGFHFRMIEGVAIYGGFAGTEDPLSFDLADRDFVANETILSGDLSGDDIFDAANGGYQGGSGDDNCYHVVYNQYGMFLTGAARLDGFTVTGGNADGSGDHRVGGGMHNYLTSPTITNILFHSNYGEAGGGMSNTGNSPTITNVSFRSNAAGGGGGMSNHSSSPTITDAVFSSNFASSGGGMSNFGSSPIITNVTFTLNEASENGGGMYSSYTSSPKLHNCIVWDNTADGDGKQFCTSGAATHTLNYCCYANGPNDVVEIGNGTFTATNCINSDPLLAEDLHLTWTNFPENDTTKSPCIDSGDPLDWLNNPADRDPDESRMDMGAFYFHQAPRITVYNDPINPDYYKFYDFEKWDIPEISDPKTFHIKNETNCFIDCPVFFEGREPDQFKLFYPPDVYLSDTLLHLTPNENKSVKVVFQPTLDKISRADFTAGDITQYTDSLRVVGEGESTGTIQGGVFSPTGFGVEGVTITATKDSLSYFSAITNSLGEYQIVNIGTGWFYIKPEKVQDTIYHIFDPPFVGPVYVSESLPRTQDFEDQSYYTVSGNISYLNTNCPVDSIPILMDGSPTGPPAYTDSAGKYTVENVLIGQHSFMPDSASTGHSFSPAEISEMIMSPVTGFDFIDEFTHTLSGYVAGAGIPLHDSLGGGCSVPLADSVGLAINCLSDCDIHDTIYTDTLGFYSIDLPPLHYTVTPLKVEYFNGVDIIFDTAELDLSEQDTICNFIYHSEPHIEMIWPDTLPARNDTIILEQFEIYALEVDVFELYGEFDEIRCRVDTGSIIVTDELSDAMQDSTLQIADSATLYYFQAGYPNIAGGGSHPYQKIIQVKYENEAKNIALAEDWLYISGQLPRGTAFATTLPDMPYIILRDPPGDGSKSKISIGKTMSQSMTFNLKHQTSLGGWAKATTCVKYKLKFLFGIKLDIAVKTEFRAGFDVSLSQNSITENQWTFETTDTFSTSSSPSFIGSDGDMYVGGAMNILYGNTDILTITEESISKSVDLIMAPNGFATTYMLSEYEIKHSVIPDLYEIQDTVSARRWESIIARNDSLKKAAIYYDNITVDAGVIYDNTTTSTQSETFTQEFEMVIKEDVAYEAGLEINGVGVSGGVNTSASVTMGSSETQTVVNSTEVYFIVSDDDQGDKFTFNIKTDPVYGTPVFDSIYGKSSCPHEENTLARQRCKFSQHSYSADSVPVDINAVFHLDVMNTSQTQDTVTYILKVLDETNPHQLTITGDDWEPELLPNVWTPVTIYIGMPPSGGDIYDFEGLTLELSSDCEPDPALADRVTFDVHFVAPCSQVSILSPGNNWVVNQSNNDILHVLLSDYNKENSELQSISLVRSPINETNWTEVFFIAKNDILSDSLEIDLDVSGLDDGEYKIRALAKCGPDMINYSEILTGTIDRNSPFSVPGTQPADGKLNIGDEISFTFNEVLDDASVTINSCQLLNNEGMAIGSGIYYDDDSKKIIFSIAPGQAYFIENQYLTSQVVGISDQYGNPLEDTVSWTFFVDQGPLHWSPDAFPHMVNNGGILDFSSNLTNASNSEIFYWLSTPEWLSSNPESGTLSTSGGSVDVGFTSDTLQNGAYYDTIFARTVGYPDEMIFVTVSQGIWEIHSVNLPAGWAGLSSYVTPQDLAIENVYCDILDHLVIAITEGEIFYPAYNINTIGNWEAHSAYKVKTNSGVSLNISGILEENKTLSLIPGWSLIPVICNIPVDAQTLFTGQDFEIVKDVAGLGILWPEYGINTLGNFVPGKAYYALMNEAGTITFPANAKDAETILPQSVELPSNPWTDNISGPATHVVALLSEGFSGLLAGDVIALVGENDQCYGISEITSLSQNAVIAAYANDPYSNGQDGFENGENMSLKLYRPQSKEVFKLSANYDLKQPNTHYFQNEGLSVITTLKASALGINEASAESIHLYPNPTNGLVELSGIKDFSRIEIYNASGKLQRTIALENQDAYKLDLSDLPGGVYQLKFTGNAAVVVKKLIRN